MQPVLLLVDTLETQEFSHILSYVILIQKEKKIAWCFRIVYAALSRIFLTRETLCFNQASGRPSAYVLHTWWLEEFSTNILHHLFQNYFSLATHILPKKLSLPMCMPIQPQIFHLYGQRARSQTQEVVGVILKGLPEWWGSRETLTPQRHDWKPHKQIPPKPNLMEFNSQELLCNWDSEIALPRSVSGKKTCWKKEGGQVSSICDHATPLPAPPKGLEETRARSSPGLKPQELLPSEFLWE